MRSRLVTALAAMTVLILVGFGWTAVAAGATEGGNSVYGPTGSQSCPNAAGWTVNQDENGDGSPDSDTVDLRPAQKPGGFLFDGPSIIHHLVAPAAGIKLEDVQRGTFVVQVKTGVAPLFKMETANPYMTINITADGRYWSSRINPGDDGGMNKPVDKPADLIGKIMKNGAPVPDTIRVSTFGVGYAKDTGNTALVKKIKFQGVTYPLSCHLQPDPTQTAVPTPTQTVTPGPTQSTGSVTPSGTATPRPTDSVAPVPGLPVTGSTPIWVALAGLTAMGSGALLYVLARRRNLTAD